MWDISCPLMTESIEPIYASSCSLIITLPQDLKGQAVAVRLWSICGSVADEAEIYHRNDPQVLCKAGE